MHESFIGAFWQNFLGQAPDWYKQTIIAFLLLNPILLLTAGSVIAGWVLVAEFIFTLALSLRCYPLQPGGLITLEAVAIGLTNPHTVHHEVFQAFPVILLLMFMVAGIFFMKELLLFTFTRILLSVRSKVLLSLLFCGVSAFLSAWLDALTVTAVVISVAVGFYTMCQRVDELAGAHEPITEEQLSEFRGFLRNLMMHAAVGTALGGVCTTVGEPQNLLIATKAEWTFAEFFVRMSIVTMPVLVVGLLTCVLLELFRFPGFGFRLDEQVRGVIESADRESQSHRTQRDVARLWVQAFAAVLLVIGLAFQWAEVGFIGLMVIVIQTAFNGIIEEHQLGHAFEEALPFTALLVVFFGVVGVIHDQHLFNPVINWVLALPEASQPATFYIANGVLSAISDNVFVATVYINEVHAALTNGTITREHFDKLTIAINTGTNIPSVATPNGQAAFLFLLTSSLAPMINLSYGRMVMLALPYTVTMGITGYLCVAFLL